MTAISRSAAIFKTPVMRIPLSAPDVTEADIDAVVQVLRTPRLSLGPQLEKFEEAMMCYVEVPHAIAVNSGTSGLHLCIRALGITEGDEVLVPSFAFIAIANAVRYERAVPVFVDIEPQALNLDPARIEAAITPRTRAVIVVHTFGCPADMGAILEIARCHDLFVIEDACEAIGAEYAGRRVGALGDMGVFGFYPNKQITTGEGGMIVTHDSRLASRCRALRNHGRGASDDWFAHSELGYNYRISEINCALGKAQLDRIESILSRRERVAHAYSQRLGGRDGIETPVLTPHGRKLSWFVYVVRLGSPLNRAHRDYIRRGLLAQGIASGRYFAPIHLQEAYEREACRKQALPVTEAVADRCLALPFFSSLGEEQIEEVCESFCSLLGDCLRHPELSQSPDSSARQYT